MLWFIIIWRQYFRYPHDVSAVNIVFFICIHVTLSSPECTFLLHLNTSMLCFLLQIVQFWPVGWLSLSTCWTSTSSHLNSRALMRPLCVKMPKWDRYVQIYSLPCLFLCTCCALVELNAAHFLVLRHVDFHWVDNCWLECCLPLELILLQGSCWKLSKGVKWNMKGVDLYKNHQ